jgi:hypothetical protein
MTLKTRFRVSVPLLAILLPSPGATPARAEAGGPVGFHTGEGLIRVAASMNDRPLQKVAETYLARSQFEISQTQGVNIRGL